MTRLKVKINLATKNDVSGFGMRGLSTNGSYGHQQMFEVEVMIELSTKLAPVK